MKNIIIAMLFLTLMHNSLSQNKLPEWEEIDNRKIPAWFEDAKFGIFIHWGVYSVPAYRPLETKLYGSYSEWYYARVYKNAKSGGMQFHNKNYGRDFEYRDFAPFFRAELYDPTFWAKTFKNAGARYVVLTSKHHDGYCLWPTKSPYKKNWNSMDVGPKRDLLGDLANAVRNENMKMGIYYSIIEWESSRTHRTDSGYFIPLSHVKKYKIPEEDYVDKHLLPQLKELVNNYQPSLIFSDGGEWDEGEEYFKTREFLTWLYKESSVKDEVVINDRWFKGMPGKHGDYYSSEYKDAKLGENHPWEESRGIGGSYGYNRAENLDDYSSSEELIIELIDIVSRGGNLLLNVGPTADGRIPVIMQQRLKDIGDWLKVNGEAIYETRKFHKPNITIDDQRVYFTQKAGNIYAIFSKWLSKPLNIPLPENFRVKNVTMLGYNGKVEWKMNNNQLEILLPQLYISEIPCFYAWTLKIESAK